MYSLSILSCSKDLDHQSGIKDFAQNFIGPSEDPCEFYINTYVESFSFISTADGSDLGVLGNVQCALLEPVHFETNISGCVDQYGNGTLKMLCSPELFDFPNLDEIPPNLEPQECEIAINSDGTLQIIDESGEKLYDGPFLDNPFGPISTNWGTFRIPSRGQVDSLERDIISRGGDVISVRNDLKILRIPVTSKNPAALISFNPIHSNILSKITFDENAEIDYSIFYHYKDGRGRIPELSKMTESLNFTVESYPDIPLVKKNHYNIHKFQLDFKKN